MNPYIATNSISQDEILAWLSEDIRTIIAALFCSLNWPWEQEDALRAEAENIVNLTAQQFRLSWWEAEHRVPADCPQDQRVIAAAQIMAEADQAADRYLEGYWPPTAPPRPAPQIGWAEWQRPLLVGGAVQGFVDLAVTWWEPRLRLVGYEFASFPELAGAESRRAPDPHRLQIVVGNWEAHQAYFLVKTTSIPAAELLREVRLLQIAAPPGDWIIVSPDATRAELLRAQGVHYVEYPGA